MRTLNRPMFRIGGSTNTGITSGLAPRQGYANGPGIVEQIQQKKSIIDALAPRTPRRDTSLSQFMIDFGLNVAGAEPSGSIFSTAAKSAQEPFQRYQQAKQLQEAYGYKEASEDRALVSDLIKGMDEDKLSAMMKKVKAGVAAGYYKDEKEGIVRQLQKEEYGVMDMPGEAQDARIRELELMISRDQEVPAGMIKSVAQHIYKIETDAYPKDIQPDLNKTKTYIKPNHIAGVKKDADGAVIEIVINQSYDKTYTFGQIYFDAQTGDLFKRTSKEGEAIIFTKVIFD
jgi:hypothetical protein